MLRNCLLVLIGLAISCTSYFGAAHANTVTFDDIYSTFRSPPVPAEYSGLSWESGWFVVNDSSYKNTYGNSYGSPSGERAASNSFGLTSVGFSSQSTFDFSRVQVAGWGYSDQLSEPYSAKTITLEGFRDGKLVASKTMPLSGSGYNLLHADFKGVDEIRFISSDNGKRWLADDIILNDNNQPTIARTQLALPYPFESSLPISSANSTAPYIKDFPSPDKLTSANLGQFVSEHGDEFSLGTRLVLRTLAGIAEVPVIGVPVGIGIDAILNPNQLLKGFAQGSHVALQSAKWMKNLIKIDFLLTSTGGIIENLSTSQTIEFYQAMLSNLDIASDLTGVSYGPVIEGLSAAFGYASDAEDLFKFTNAAYVKDPMTFMLVLNEHIWFDLVSSELKILGEDPLDPSYSEVYIPPSTVEIEVPDLGDERLQELGERMLTAGLTYYQVLDALNITFDRYAAAYLAGDSSSATLQLQAWLYYLNITPALSEQYINVIDEFQLAFSGQIEPLVASHQDAIEIYERLMISLTSQSPSELVGDYFRDFLGVDIEALVPVSSEFKLLSPDLNGLIDFCLLYTSDAADE